MVISRDETWLADWLDGVISGKTVMSQRSVAFIDRHGGVARAIEAAHRRGVHLPHFTDDHGKDLIAASLRPFRALC